MSDGWNDWVRVGNGTLAARLKRPWHYTTDGISGPTLCRRRFPAGTEFNVRFGSTLELIRSEKCCKLCLAKFKELAGRAGA